MNALFFLFVLSLVHPLLVFLRRWSAHNRLLMVALDTLRAAYLPLLILAANLHPSGLRTGIAGVGLVLALWGIWHDIREWRLAKRAAEPAVAADGASTRR